MILKNVSKLKKNVKAIFNPVRRWHYKRLYYRF